MFWCMCFHFELFIEHFENRNIKILNANVYHTKIGNWSISNRHVWDIDMFDASYD